MRPILFWTAAVLLAAIALAGAGLSAFGPERIAFTGVDLQERVNRALPRQFHNVMVNRGTVSVAEGRITVRVETTATLMGRTIAAAATARGVPQYNAERGEVFFDADDVKVDEVKVDDSGSRGTVKPTGIRIGGRLAEQIEKQMPHIMEAAAGLATGGIKMWLASRPVYRFKDDIKGVIIKATLTDIAVKGDTLVIGVSLIRLGAAAFAWLAGLVLVVLGAVWFWVVQGDAREEFAGPPRGAG
jgi:hypothetical protein